MYIKEKNCFLDNYQTSLFLLLLIVHIIYERRIIFLLLLMQKHRLLSCSRSTLNAFHLIPGLHEQRNRRAPYILFYSARGCSAHEMHTIAIKLTWTIVAALCSRDMGSVYLEKEQKNHTATRII